MQNEEKEEKKEKRKFSFQVEDVFIQELTMQRQKFLFKTNVFGKKSISKNNIDKSL